MKKRSFWPYGILISILLVVIAGVVTIIISLDYPVELDNYYFETYQNVEKNFDKIEKLQNKFNQKYHVIISPKILQIDKNNTLSLQISPQPNKLKIEAIITRPDTNKLNQKINFKLENNKFISVFTPSKFGRWQLMVKITDANNTVGFFTKELNAK